MYKHLLFSPLIQQEQETRLQPALIPQTEVHKKVPFEGESFVLLRRHAAAGKMNHMKNVWTLGLLELPAKMFHDS